MDPIEKYLKQVVGININGHEILYDLTNSWGKSPIEKYKIDRSIDSEKISRLRWSRYNVLFFLARARGLSIVDFPQLFNGVDKLTGQIHYRRLAILFDFFRNLGTLLDSLAEEANIIYVLGEKKEKITITKLIAIMQGQEKQSQVKNRQEKEFIDKIKGILCSPLFQRIIEFRHIATHRPKLIWITGGHPDRMYLPIDPQMDPDDEKQHGPDAFMPTEKPAIADINEMLSYVIKVIEEFYKLTNRHFRELYIK